MVTLHSPMIILPAAVGDRGYHTDALRMTPEVAVLAEGGGARFCQGGIFSHD